MDKIERLRHAQKTEGWSPCRSGKEPEARDLPQTNHVGANIESFARAALGQGQFHIPDDAILHTVAALEAVFKSADQDGAWQAVE
jgi:hypothetical protein